MKSQPVDQDLLPITDDEVRSIEQLASEPLERLVVALSVEHACRTAVIRKLTLDDIDLPNRRITLAGHNQRLGELTHIALNTWLDHRRDRWPHTPNRHVLLTTKTALRTTPVSQKSVKPSLSDNGFTIERIRADRILHEALTAGRTHCTCLSSSASPTTPHALHHRGRTAAQRRTRAAGRTVVPPNAARLRPANPPQL
ncbi:phage integrase family protein [Mycobacterium intracellulare MIN_061107_1834]|nr:phage integrase family protein [Mycobacterium intracellulare MIN_061107_1834]